MSACERWTELNVGPFYVDTQSEVAAARDDLTQLEQLRWVLGGLLESKDLPSVWPLRILLTRENEGTKPAEFVWQNGQNLLIAKAGTRLPLDQVCGILLDNNTPRLPPEVESGLRQLFSTLEAHGSRVTWGGPVPRPNLAWARMQLFATKFEYGLSFHIFIAAVKNGSSLRVAEGNAFGKDPDELEKEAAANLARGNGQPVAVSGRPLDPKRDFGEHSIDGVVAEVYLADARLSTDPKSAEAAYKAAIEAGGDAMPLGYEGLAEIAKRQNESPRRYVEDAMRAGSKSPLIYVMAAQDRPAGDALPLLKRAAQLNPLWAEPVLQQAQLATNPAEKEALVKKATQLAPRQTRYWIELAHIQTEQGQASAAQGSWLRAEDSAPTDAEREKIHNQRISTEQERLDAAEAERRRERDAAHADIQRAQDAETARVRAAEEKANRELDAQAGGSKPAAVVPWDATVPQKKVVGTLTQVDCLKGPARITVKLKTGNTIQLLIEKPSEAKLSCGPQQPAPRVSISYAAEPDERLHTEGRVSNMQVQ
ncbi:MAG: hypothetical protein JOZ62_09215 [Acidobacteriaceae bacterium]|nr:hypothetical protein [Acidobacteriaceae bacterium]